MRSSRRSLNRRRDNGGEDEPLAGLRRRCMAGVGVSAAAYLAVPIFTVTHPKALALNQTICLEVAIGILGLLFAIVAIVIWLLTESTAFVLAVSKAVSAASTANAALETELLGEAGPDETPIPIQRGREIRQHRTDRHAG